VREREREGGRASCAGITGAGGNKRKDWSLVQPYPGGSDRLFKGQAPTTNTPFSALPFSLWEGSSTSFYIFAL